jgi:DNA polymerase zeta
VDGVTQKNKFGFKLTQRQKTTSAEQELHYMSIMSIEIHGLCLALSC